MSLLDIKELSLTFGDKSIYKNAEVALFKGEHMGIVGANGVGKSTLIHLCAGLLVPDEGRLVWQPGIQIGYLDQHVRTEGKETVLEYLHSLPGFMLWNKKCWRHMKAVRHRRKPVCRTAAERRPGNRPNDISGCWRLRIFIPSITGYSGLPEGLG